MNDSIENALPVELHFSLDVVDEWPPVAIEGILCIEVDDGYRIESPPLFIKGLSVGDVISIELDPADNVIAWQVLVYSSRTTVWILRTGPKDNISTVVRDLQAIDCKVVELPTLGCYSVDVPAEVCIDNVDACLAQLDTSSTAVAFPSFRHGPKEAP